MSVSGQSQTGFVQNVPRYGSSQFELQDVVCGGQHTLLLTGELDIASCPPLDAAIAEVCTDGTNAVVLDLSKLTFMDSTGIHVVLVAKGLCAAHGCDFLVIPGQPQVLRVLAVSGLLDHLPLWIDNNDTGSALSGAHGHNESGSLPRPDSRSLFATSRSRATKTALPI